MGQEKTNSTVRIDMLHGGIFRKLLLFALPLIASGILQQSFNSVDVAVVGQFASSQALAAVGSNGLVISLIIDLFIGISIGANVVIAHYIGRQDEKGIKNAISTTAIIAVTSGIFLLITGLLIAKPILEALDTPEDVIDLAVLYLRIYSLGGRSHECGTESPFGHRIRNECGRCRRRDRDFQHRQCRYHRFFPDP